MNKYERAFSVLGADVSYGPMTTAYFARHPEARAAFDAGFATLPPERVAEGSAKVERYFNAFPDAPVRTSAEDYNRDYLAWIQHGEVPRPSFFLRMAGPLKVWQWGAIGLGGMAFALGLAAFFRKRS